MRCAIINSQTDVVDNVIELSETSVWRAHEGFYLVVAPTAGIGYKYQDGVFIQPVVEEAPPEDPGE